MHIHRNYHFIPPALDSNYIIAPNLSRQSPGNSFDVKQTLSLKATSNLSESLSFIDSQEAGLLNGQRILISTLLSDPQLSTCLHELKTIKQ